MAYTPSTAIVTGSDSGIGRATALALAEAGCDVGDHLALRRGRRQRDRASGPRVWSTAVVTQLDTTDAPACGDVIDQMISELGGLDVFVNNAGVNGGTPFMETSYDEWRGTVAANLDGAFVCIQRAAAQMISAGNGGRIIAVTSVHQEQPRVGSAAYDASKHGLGGLIKTIALELGEQGITANAVLPGEISTPMNDAEDDDPHEIDRPGIPLGRPGASEEVAAVIAFLASPRVQLRQRRVLGCRRRHAADGPPGRFAPHQWKVAHGLAFCGPSTWDSQGEFTCRSGGIGTLRELPPVPKGPPWTAHRIPERTLWTGRPCAVGSTSPSPTAATARWPEPWKCAPTMPRCCGFSSIMAPDAD